MAPTLKPNTCPERSRGKLYTLDTLYKLFFYFSILLFIIGFNFTDSPPPFGWYQQFMPSLNGASITDITFTDSLNGYAVTNIGASNSYILKTTNSGDNWTINFVNNQMFARIEFINPNTGFTNAFTKIFKTTNAGNNWNPINLPGIFGDDMFVLNQDTIWLAMSESLTGGVYLTTDGGVSWDRQANFGSGNPNKIYMFNARIGFIAQNPPVPNQNRFRKTTNGGVNWDTINNYGGFYDMYFIDSLTGWRAKGDTMKKTTDGGLSWTNQILPNGGIIITSSITHFSNVNKDTIWGVGGFVTLGSGNYRGMLYRTTNGGQNWYYQIPDTAIHITSYAYVKFVDKKKGWAYHVLQGGIHTTTGGDTNWLGGIKQVSSKIPVEFKLYQNYPNPFNPVTNIKYQIINNSYVKLIVFDIMGKEVKTLVNQKQTQGEYTVDFDGLGLSSGVYFYKIEINSGKEVFIETKKMLLIK